VLIFLSIAGEQMSELYCI